MKREEAIKIQKKYAKAALLCCRKCGEYAVCVYNDKYSNAWHHFHGKIDWRGIRPVCVCGGSFEWEDE